MSSVRWNKTHRLILLVAWLGWTFDIMDVALFQLAKQGLVTELLGGEAAYKARGAAVEANLMSLTMLGWSIGGLAFGIVADRWGRVRTLSLTILLYSVFTGLTVFCRDLTQLQVLRVLTGIGIGGEWAAGAALVAESVPDSTRAKAAAWLQSAAAFGPALAALANYFLAPFGWRALFLFGVVPALLTLVLRRRVPEPERPTKPAQSKDRPQIRRMAIALLLGTAGIAIATNVSFWLPNLVAAVSPGIGPEELASRKSTATLVLHIGTLAGVFAVPWLCEKVGRRLALLLAFLLSPVAILIVAASARSYEALLFLAPLMSLPAIGIGAGFALYFPELFPSSQRATGAGVAYNGGRVLAGLFPLLTAALIQSNSGDVAKSVAQTSVVLLVGALALAFSPETRGKPLEA